MGAPDTSPLVSWAGPSIPTVYTRRPVCRGGGGGRGLEAAACIRRLCSVSSRQQHSQHHNIITQQQQHHIVITYFVSLFSQAIYNLVWRIHCVTYHQGIDITIQVTMCHKSYLAYQTYKQHKISDLGTFMNNLSCFSYGHGYVHVVHSMSNQFIVY